MGRHQLRIGYAHRGAPPAGRPPPTGIVPPSHRPGATSSTRTGGSVAASDIDTRRLMRDLGQPLGFDLMRVNPDEIPHLPERSHDFCDEQPWVSSDLLGLLLRHAGPRRRGLAAQDADGGARYGTLPPHCDARVRRLFAPHATGTSVGAGTPAAPAPSQR